MASSRQPIPLPLPVQGARPDLDDFHVPPDALRSTSYNWLLRNGKIVTRPGLTALGQDVGSDVPLGIATFVDSAGARHHIFASEQRWWRYLQATDTWEDITAAGNPWSGSVVVPVDFRFFSSGGGSGFLIGVNGVNQPMVWRADPQVGGLLADTLTGNPPIARCIAIVADRVVLGHFFFDPNDPSGVDVSAFQDHTSGWRTTQTATLVDSSGFIVSMNELGASRAAIYKTNSIYLASGTAGLAPIRFDIQVAETSGPISSATVVSLNAGLHAVFARDNHLYFFDGINYTRHSSSDKIRIEYEKNASVDPVGKAKAHAHYNRTHNELWFFYTRTGLELIGPRDAIVLNLNNGSIWNVNFTNAAFSFTASHFGELSTTNSLRDVAFLGNSVGRIFLSEEGLDLTLPIDALMEQGLSDLGLPTLVKTVQETQHYFARPSSTQTPSVSVLASESGADPDVSDSQTLTITDSSVGPYFTGHRTAGGNSVTSRFVGIRIEDDSLTESLEYRGTSVTIAPRGTR